MSAGQHSGGVKNPYRSQGRTHTRTILTGLDPRPKFTPGLLYNPQVVPAPTRTSHAPQSLIRARTAAYTGRVTNYTVCPLRR